MPVDQNLAEWSRRAGEEAFLEGVPHTVNPADRLPFPHHSRPERAEIRAAWEKGWNDGASIAARRLEGWLRQNKTGLSQ
jgi:hypothetical protein